MGREPGRWVSREAAPRPIALQDAARRAWQLPDVGSAAGESAAGRVNDTAAEHDEPGGRAVRTPTVLLRSALRCTSPGRMWHGLIGATSTYARRYSDYYDVHTEFIVQDQGVQHP